MDELDLCNPNKWTVEKVEKIQQIIAMGNLLSLDQPINPTLDGTQDTVIGDTIEDLSPGPEEIAIQQDNQRLLLDIMDKCLGAREITVIKLRFGFEGQPLTLEEIGKFFHVTRERIRQIEAKGLMKIRRYMRNHEIFKRSDWNVD